VLDERLMAFKRSPLRHSSPILLHRTGWSKGRERPAPAAPLVLGGIAIAGVIRSRRSERTVEAEKPRSYAGSRWRLRASRRAGDDRYIL